MRTNIYSCFYNDIHDAFLSCAQIVTRNQADVDGNQSELNEFLLERGIGRERRITRSTLFNHDGRPIAELVLFSTNGIDSPISSGPLIDEKSGH